MGGRGKMGRDGERLGKGWGKVEESVCGFVEVCVGLWRSMEVCGGLCRSVEIYGGLWRFVEVCGGL